MSAPKPVLTDEEWERLLDAVVGLLKERWRELPPERKRAILTGREDGEAPPVPHASGGQRRA